MSVFAIGDLHLSFSVEKPMDIYGGEWIDHTTRLAENWRSLVKEEDTVILAGDISWALRFEESLLDLQWISELPGKKILFKGNHDLWWSSANKLNQLHEKMTFIQNRFVQLESQGNAYAICGTRGWICPGEDGFTKQDEKIYKRELGRFKLSLDAATSLGYGKKGRNKGKILCCLHFPPTNDKHQGSGFTDLCTEYGVETLVYGHLHGRDAYKNGIQDIYNGVDYKLVSLDYLKCIPLKIVD